MNKEDKELLLKDLCARLPYRVIVHIHDINVDDYDRQLIGEDIDFIELDRRNCKPYLRLMSSMTREEKKEYDSLFKLYEDGNVYCENWEYFDWMNKHHFDYRNLISRGLAIEAPEGMYK